MFSPFQFSSQRATLFYSPFFYFCNVTRRFFLVRSEGFPALLKSLFAGPATVPFFFRPRASLLFLTWRGEPPSLREVSAKRGPPPLPPFFSFFLCRAGPFGERRDFGRGGDFPRFFLRGSAFFFFFSSGKSRFFRCTIFAFLRLSPYSPIRFFFFFFSQTLIGKGFPFFSRYRGRPPFFFSPPFFLPQPVFFPERAVIGHVFLPPFGMTGTDTRRFFF